MLDPGTGPLQSFAQDLRQLRREAGAPTYRTLARTAGYSATTLSEAASGRRLPTLDVVLAYVGACGGDPAQWHRRWCEVDAALRSPDTGSGAVAEEQPIADTGVAARDAGPAAVVLPSPAGGQPVPTGPAGGRLPRSVTAAAIAAAMVLSAGATVWAFWKPYRTAGPECPPLQAGAAFTGVTYGGGAHGCLHHRPSPASVSLVATADAARPGVLDLAATGVHADIVGFTASANDDPDVPGGRAWRQVALTEPTGTTFRAELRLDALGVVAADQPLIIVAAACYGGDGPSGVQQVSDQGARR